MPQAPGLISVDGFGRHAAAAYNPTSDKLEDIRLDDATKGLLVTQAPGQIQDLFITGATAQMAINNNVMLASAGAGSVDTLNGVIGGESFRSFSCQIVASAGISAGQITFEGSNDNINFHSLTVFDDAIATGAVITGAITIAASTSRFFSGTVKYRYVRCRISTAFTGGTIQAFTRFGNDPYIPRVLSVGQPTASNLQVTANSPNPTPLILNAAATVNATSVKASAGLLTGLMIANVSASPRYFKLFNKASAPTVGTDIPAMTIVIPAGGYVNVDAGLVGYRFSTGIAFAITGAAADTDATAIAAGDVKVFLNYI